MGALTPGNTSSLLSTFSVFLSLGVGVFIVSMAILIFLFGWSIKDTLKNTRGIIALFMIAFLGTIMLKQLSNKNIPLTQASTIVGITKVETSFIENKTVRVTVVTSSPVSGYLEYSDYSRSQKDVVLPTVTNPDNNYVFYIYNVGDKGGEAALIVNKQKLLFNGKPISITSSNKTL